MSNHILRNIIEESTKQINFIKVSRPFENGRQAAVIFLANIIIIQIIRNNMLTIRKVLPKDELKKFITICTNFPTKSPHSHSFHFCTRGNGNGNATPHSIILKSNNSIIHKLVLIIKAI